MAISGAIKFFNKSKTLFADGVIIAASPSGDASASRAIDKNTVTYWRSVMSDDTITELLEITLTSNQIIDRILLLDHNWKQFTVMYWSGAAYVNFTGVVGIDGALGGGISETVFSDDTAYYEVIPVTTNKILITILKTQTANEEKYINQIIATEEFGTLSGYPIIRNTTIDRNSRRKEMLSGKILLQKSEEAFQVELNFNRYPASLSSDVDLIFGLHDIEENFLVWLCGGKRGANYFTKQMRGYRLRDVFCVQMTAAIKPIYSDNIYKNTLNFSAKLEEAVD